MPGKTVLSSSKISRWMEMEGPEAECTEFAAFVTGPQLTDIIPGTFSIWSDR